MTTEKPITERGYGNPLILVTALFFLWALGVNLNDVLIPHLKKVFDLNDFQSALIQVAFFGGYCLSALPAGRLLERIGYKNGIVVGLVTCAVGAVVTPFIGAAFILSVLEYSHEQLTTMTPAETAAYRTAVVSTVRMPYLVIAGVFLAYAVVIFLSQLPEVGVAGR